MRPASDGGGDRIIRQKALAVAVADVSASSLRTSIRAIAIGPPESKGRHPSYLGVLISCRLIGRFLFDYIGNSPITRTDEHDLIISDEEHVGSSLRHFLHDFGRKWIELNIIRYNITDRFWRRVFLLHVRVLKNFSNNVLLFRCQREARSGSDGRWGIGLCLYIFAGRPQGDQPCNRGSNSQKT